MKHRPNAHPQSHPLVSTSSLPHSHAWQYDPHTMIYSSQQAEDAHAFCK